MGNTRKLIVGENDLKTLFPDIAREWDYDNNEGTLPENYLARSNHRASWKCSVCHGTFQTAIHNRTLHNTACPFCTGHKALKGLNDLTTTNPDLLSEWDYLNNEGHDPTNYTKGSHYKAHWICKKCGYRWAAQIKTRTSGVGCPACGNKNKAITHQKKKIKREGSLQEHYPEIAKEWDYEANGDLKPSDVSYGSKKDVGWICSACGNHWKAAPNSRTHMKSGCPKCNDRRKTSFHEQAIYYYVKQFYPKAISRCSYVLSGKQELDIYIPEIHTAIEYDGQHWHQSETAIQRDTKKYKECLQKHIYLIRVSDIKRRVEDTHQICDKYIYSPFRYPLFESLNPVIAQICECINIKYTPHVEYDYYEIEQMYYSDLAIHSLEIEYPAICLDWDYEENGFLRPSMVYPGSIDRIHWCCHVCGHKWVTSPNNRTNGNRQTGCPHCYRSKAGQRFRSSRLIRGQNDLKTLFPEIAKEWDFEANGQKKPEDFTKGSGERINWKCSTCGRNWVATIKDRTGKKSGCPYCSGRKK